MKLILKNAESSDNQRLSITKKEIPCLDSSWHYHAQYELLYISQSNGIRFVGDNVSQFFPGDLVLVGPYLPHLWRNDASFYKENNTLCTVSDNPIYTNYVSDISVPTTVPLLIHTKQACINYLPISTVGMNKHVL